jgi:predicted unusual protein kinase regulating ubiquinone biosynthesis (AarF/ABC1/UbiB family)
MFTERPRSLKMQIRFWRALAFAWWTFGRLLFWYFVMPKIIGQARVERGNMGRWVKYARQFRRFAISMGGLMIKLGQFISTRVDILPEDIIRELASLQDEVPSVPYDEIRAVIEQELGAIPGRFQSIDETPVAAASVGQVHRARLLNGDKVAVKVQRPGIREICYTDMAALAVVAKYAMKFRFIRRRADTVALVSEFNRVVLEELSYRHEAENAAKFAKLFLADMGVYIPEVYNEHSTDHVITLEDVTAIKVNDYAALEAAGISRKAVAARLMDTYLKQIFEERFFHADPHPGNLFVYPLPVENGAKFGKDGRPFYLIFIDFGMTGTLTPKIASGLVNTLGAIVARDAKKMIESYQNLGILLPDADLNRLEEATKATFDQVWGLSMSQIQNIN